MAQNNYLCGFVESRTLIFLTIALVSIFGLVGTISAMVANSNFRAELKPVRESLIVLPSQVSAVGWSNVETLGLQDLSSDSLFQEFNKVNSAYITEPVEVDQSLEQNLIIEDQGVINGDPAPEAGSTSEIINEVEDFETSLSEPVVSENNLETEPDLGETSVESSNVVSEATNTTNEDKPKPEPETESESVDITIPDPAEVSFFNKAFGLFTLAQVVTTTPVVVGEEFSGVESLSIDNDLLVETETSLNLELEINPALELEDIEDIQDVEVPILNLGEEVIGTTSITEVVPDEATLLNDSDTPKDPPVNENLNSNLESGNSITLRDFGVPQLASGQFIENLNLRISLAGQYENDPDQPLASVFATYSFGEFSGSSGAILLDSEVSNAINGDYFVMSLPSIQDPALLADLEIKLSFTGEKEKLDTLFIDAVWVEVGTVIYDEKLLKERIKVDNFAHLKTPEYMDFLSGDIDFTRNELPKFSLKYNSQRNFIVKTFRSLFADSFAEIEQIKVVHKSSEEVGVTPTVTINDEGLVNILFSEEDTNLLSPGEYTVEVRVKEGDYVSSDFFSFQWGMLSINTSQTTYHLTDLVKVSMGALTPNGNTVCEANLSLFITDPRGYISNVPVTESGQCFGNNVVDVPDFASEFVVDEPGEYKMYLERIDEFGQIISHTNKTFLVNDEQRVLVERSGPTRIYPAAPYVMSLNVKTFDRSFNGELVERVPGNFVIKDTEASVDYKDGYIELVWNLAILNNSQQSVYYEFDAPDLSPFLFELGPAKLLEQKSSTASDASLVEQFVALDVINDLENAVVLNTEDATITAELTQDVLGNVENVTDPIDGVGLEDVEEFGLSLSNNTPDIASDVVDALDVNQVVFEESESWQIASDAVGNMILFWDDGASIPAGWTCLSCGSGTFFQRFAMGSSTYNNTGGSATHTHTASGSVFTTSLATTFSDPNTRISNVSHNHTYTPIIQTVNHLPPYRQLRVIQYTSAAGEPPTIPSGAIGIFDATVPAGFTQYSAQDDRYIYGEDTPGTSSGSLTHRHTITGTTGLATGGEENRTGNAFNAAARDHTHTVSSTTASSSNEANYITVILGKANSATTTPEGMLSLWTADVPTGWLDVSTAPTAPFSNRFLKPSTTYGITGGANTHAPADVNGIVSSGPSATDDANGGSAGASDVHTHNVNVTNFSTTSNLPPYITAVVGRRQGTDPTYRQKDFRWYTNLNSQTPTDPWPSGVQDLDENNPITSTSTPVKNGDLIRLRISTSVTNATSSAGVLQPKLQYGVGDTCSAVSVWSDVGASGSSTVWRGYNNTSVTDGSTLSSTTLASTTVAQTYEESYPNTATPNQIDLNAVAEWDFVLEQNGASPGTNYCFRLIEDDNSVFFAYNNYAKLYTNQAPVISNMEAPFDNEKSASTTPYFEFEGSDPETNTLHYAIEIDDDYSFASPIIQRNTVNDSTLFENQALISDKAPFISDNLIRFIPSSSLTNGITYYWRVRSLDPTGSNNWGSWSTVQSVTIDTSLTASAWFQTTEEQFATNALVGTKVNVTDNVDLISGSTTGSVTSTAIDFDDRVNGTVWDELSFTDTETASDLKYKIQYRNAGVWADIPDSALSGNSTGFDTTVSLLDLDTELYNIIRIVATFTNSGSSPILSDWTLSWGYRVETPTITKLFPNERTGTSTPTFEFVTNDPQADDLTYQIQWSTSDDFTSSTTRTSNQTPPTGFINRDNGVDTDPFDSGEIIQYTIQSADALTDNQTYWWRVRAKDPLDTNAYSQWTEPQSFTVSSTTEVSTWFQTVKSQFDNNLNTGVTTTPGAVTVSTVTSEAMIVYGEGTSYLPKYRTWDGLAWSTEAEALTVGAPISWVITEAAPTREEYISVTLGTDSDINAQIYSNGEWGNLQEITTSVNNANKQGFAVAYETLSGDAMVIACDGDEDPSYYIWNGVTWSGPSTLNATYGGNCEWIKIASDPVSDEIIVIIKEDGDGRDADAWVWDGSAWGNEYTIGRPEVVSAEGIDIGYEESGGQALLVVQDRTFSRFVGGSWNGTTWSSLGNITTSNPVYFSEMAFDDGTDNGVLCYVGSGGEVGVLRWTGSAWTGLTTLEATANSNTDRPVSCQFETGGARDGYIMVTYSDTTNVRYRFWNGTVWSTEASIDTTEDSSVVQLRRTGEGKLLNTVFDDVNDQLVFSYWNGSVWSSSTVVENDPSVSAIPFKEPYMVAPRKPSSVGRMTGMPAVIFSDGTGPYWDKLSWVDSEPGISTALYQVQYRNATGSWLLIPDLVIPGNSVGTTTSPINLTGLSVSTYDTLRPLVTMSCDGANCPTLNDWTLEWAGGINVSGTIQAYDQTTNVNSGTVGVAVNGTLQTGKVGTISGGTWNINNVTAFPGDIVTVFVSGAGSASEAVGVTRYDGTGDIDGMSLYELHLTLGSNDATTTPLTNANIGGYDVTKNEDSFIDLVGNDLYTCGDSGCDSAEIYIKSGVVYIPGGRLITHDFENNGTFTAGSFAHEVSGSWDNNATTTMTGSTFIFTATSTSETVDNTGAVSSIFNNLTFGTTTGSGATWTPVTSLDIDGNLSVDRGTLARGTTSVTVAGNLSTGANGFWTGLGTTTFDGVTTATWNDQNATKQNIGRVVVDGTAKIVTLAGNVAAESILIAADDTLDATVINYDITVYDSWINQNNFIARGGEVFFAATDGSNAITSAGDAFYDLTFSGIGGTWAFTEPTLLVNNNFRALNGVVTLPTGTTTIAGSFDSTGGTFAHNNGAIRFTTSGSKTITLAGGPFTNVLYNSVFDGSGSWTFVDSNATNTNDITVTQGTVTFPSGVLAVGGTLIDNGGTYNGGSGTVRFYSSVSEVITAGGSSFNNVEFNGSGSWSFADSSLAALGDLLVSQGTLTLPNGVFLLGGSLDNNATILPGTGTLTFNSSDTGETVNFGSSVLYNVSFLNSAGGWTLTAPATTTNNFILASGTAWTISSGLTLSVGGTFTNSIGGASTTWTGSTLSLESGNYSLNTKTVTGDSYETIRVAANTDIKMWNSVAVTYDINGTGSLYSQDHNAINGDLYIFGNYVKNSGNEYWSYATDFDGTDLSGGSERQANVRFSSGSSADFASTTIQIIGLASASTTVANQGAGNYTISVSNGTTSAQYYSFSDLGSTGVSLLNGVKVPLLRDGSYTASTAAGSALTLSSTTIDANPGKQIYAINFATTTAISAYNVSQIDGAPTSYWWFREGTGNLYGEINDNDTGDPGSIRFDDSSLVITASGTVFSDEGISPIVGGTCDGVAPVVRIVVSGGASYTGSCSNVDGTYNIGGIVIVGDPTLTIYLDNASGGERGSVITRTPTSNLTDLDIYANRVIVRNEDTSPLNIENLAIYDNDNDNDLKFVAATSSFPYTLTVFPDNELFVFASSTFAPGGDVVVSADAAANGYDGTLYIDDNATFIGSGTSTYTIGGRFVLDTGATFEAASSSVIMNATTTGKSITAASVITFNDLNFNGVGGGWNLGAGLQILGNMSVTEGTVTGTGDIAVINGSLSGNGVLSLGGGTVTLEKTNTLGGTSAWTFNNLTLGSGLIVGTTTLITSATTTVLGVLTIANAHFLEAGSSVIDLAGTGNVFIETGTYLEDTSTMRFSGSTANVPSTNYFNLLLEAGIGSATYTAVGLGLIVENDLVVGGTASSTFTLNTNDPALLVEGSVRIANNGTLVASNSANFTVLGDWVNTGTFTPSSGMVRFNGSGSSAIYPGASSFANVDIDGTGAFTVFDHATATDSWRLVNHSSFTLASGQTLSVGGVFLNNIAGGATTWTGSNLSLYGVGIYDINDSATTDDYGTLTIGAGTQIRMWNSTSTTYNVNSAGSLYSQDHASVDGELYIFGAMTSASGDTYWSYDQDFDGVDISGGGERPVNVYFASGTSAVWTGGTLSINGTSSATTTIQNQGSGTYSIAIGGNTTADLSYYSIRDIDSNGLILSGVPTISSLSNGDFEVSQSGGTAITVGGTVITANPAKNFTQNRFALNGVGSGFNVTATGTTVSSWRFTNHTGDIDGETYDVDPDGDPGYVSWDDSAALITISGNVYSNEGATTSTACDGATDNVTLWVAGITEYNTSCNATTGLYTIPNVSYGTNDSLIVYIDGETEKGAVVSKQPISNISNLHIYENRVIVRHENSNPITVADMAVWDSSNDGDVPFTAVDAGTDTLTLPANRKLIVWTGKEFTPNGNVTVSGNGLGNDYDGTVQLFSSAKWNGQGTESLTIGGSFILDTSAVYTTSNGTTTFTTTGTARTIDTNLYAFNNLAFSGSGSWTISDPTLQVQGNFTKTSGSLTFPTGTSTFNGSFSNTGGAFTASNGLARFTGSGSRTLIFGNSSLATVVFAGGNYTFADINATTTGSVTINSGTITLPSGNLAVGGNFQNLSGTISHNTSDILMTATSTATVIASSSSLYALRFVGPATYILGDENLTLLDSFEVASGTVLIGSGTLAVGGSFTATGGTFAHSTGTVLLNATASGKVLNPGVSSLYNLQFGAPTGGYTVTGNATTTKNLVIANVSSLLVQPGISLSVLGVFLNSVGGTNTTWTGSTLTLAGQNAYSINTKSSGGDAYGEIILGDNSDLKMWNSSAATTTVAMSSSLYSQDHNAVNGELHIFGDYHIATTTEYWSYATDFDGTSLTGSERSVTVAVASNATTTVDTGTLQIIGILGNETTITNQGSGQYAFKVNGGVLNAQRYRFRNLNLDGLYLSGMPTVTSLSYGDFELAVNGGSLITLSSTTLNANASLVSVGNVFATTTAIGGYNVNLVGDTANAWTFTTHSGNLDGEDNDIDGITECGSIRWSDSSCLLTQQTQYRWRNDDGGLNVPTSEWFNSNWDARKMVRIFNDNATSTADAVIQLFVTYDGDMQADFDDLRFTDDDGLTSIPHWIGSSTLSGAAEIWVKVPLLPAEDTATIFMYYNNPTATTTSSSTQTFIASDDFEDGNISEYSGQTTLFSVNATFNYDGINGLDNFGNTLGRANTGGIYRLDQTVSQGETFRFWQYVDAVGGATDEVCTKFAVQATTSVPNKNYAICVELPGTDHISLVKDVTDTESSGIVIASSTYTFTTGWYEFEVKWDSGGNFAIDLYTEDGGSSVASIDTSDTTYSSGGIGFTYWYNHGGWDSLSSRPLLTTEPSILFGAEQIEGGASWKASQNSSASYNINDVARLRVAVENSGLAITNQELLLEYAELGLAPSCEAVSASNYSAVPPQASCGTSPVCMQGTTNYTNNASTVDLLFNTQGSFIAGEAIESPSNITGLLDIDQNEYTELEYAITPTVNITDSSFCFRVSDNGSDLDTYLKVAQLQLVFDPSFGAVSLNAGLPVSLTPGTTTQVLATTTVTDLNGYTDLAYATATVYRSGVGPSCTSDNNNCYILSTENGQCTFTNCSGNSCTLSCVADIPFHADPTDAGAYEGEEWLAYTEVEDASSGYDFASASGVELLTLRAISVDSLISYGSLEAESDTGSSNATSTIVNLGNVPVDVDVTGTDLSDGASSFIPANQQKVSTSTFAYSACVSCQQLSSTTPVTVGINLAKPAVQTPPVETDVYWGIAVPFGINSAPHSGINIFTPIDI